MTNHYWAVQQISICSSYTTKNLPVEREIVRISDEVHLDIAHYSRKLYRQTRELRLHPWLGPILYGCKILYDPQHFMDFTQASVRGQFYRPDQVMGRVQPQVENARQIWLAFTSPRDGPDNETVSYYLRGSGVDRQRSRRVIGETAHRTAVINRISAEGGGCGAPGTLSGIVGFAWRSDGRCSCDTRLAAWMAPGSRCASGR